jgi:hypothetical protein
MKYLYIGWCQEGTHDKVWGIISLMESQGTFLTVWGRRGAKLQTKMWTGSSYEASEMFRKKKNNGYRQIEEWQLADVYPEFQSDLEKTAFWAALKA